MSPFPPHGLFFRASPTLLLLLFTLCAGCALNRRASTSCTSDQYLEGWRAIEIALDSVEPKRDQHLGEPRWRVSGISSVAEGWYVGLVDSTKPLTLGAHVLVKVRKDGSSEVYCGQ